METSYLCIASASYRQTQTNTTMAILRSVYLKGASQRLGGVVLYQSQGRTLARELAPSVSNPRTPSQMVQRVRLANVVAVYRANRNWMPGSFEDKKQSESDYNAFVSANLAVSLVATSKSEAAAGAAVVAPYKVTSGSLPTVEHSLTASQLITNLNLGVLSIGSSTTVGQLSTALIGNNNNIREGMQLSLVINIQQMNAAAGIPYIVVRAYELIIDTNSAELLSEFFPGTIIASTGGASNSLAIQYTSLGSGAATFILSETVSGKTRVSTQSLVMFGPNTVYTSYTSEQAWSAAVASYGENAVNFLDANSAAGAPPVDIALSVVSLNINEQTITPGGIIVGGIRVGDVLTVTFNRPISTSASVESRYYIGSSSTQHAVDGINIATDGMSFEGQMSFAIAQSGEESVRLIVIVDGISYPVNFTVQADIS